MKNINQFNQIYVLALIIYLTSAFTEKDSSENEKLKIQAHPREFEIEASYSSIHQEQQTQMTHKFAFSLPVRLGFTNLRLDCEVRLSFNSNIERLPNVLRPNHGHEVVPVRDHGRQVWIHICILRHELFAFRIPWRVRT